MASRPVCSPLPHAGAGPGVRAWRVKGCELTPLALPGRHAGTHRRLRLMWFLAKPPLTPTLFP
ncbi:hypothetical protein CBM2623_A320157 [Cupriavidus taiwanensis]|nr:hypothetical protein CBM2608_A330048 [Cupriavidus taiwanensis]SPA29456.1 hypothetical protein CBM2623_A320157 [Cupriavidus taiwanensis]SPA46079.1 hypothetical protein CBM2629_A290161 [Cupriavidus taiwanensis]